MAGFQHLHPLVSLLKTARPDFFPERDEPLPSLRASETGAGRAKPQYRDVPKKQAGVPARGRGTRKRSLFVPDQGLMRYE